MKKFTLFLALAVTVMASAQVLEVTGLQRLNTPANSDAKVAGIAPDGSYILLTTSANKGLLKYDMATSEVTTISEAEGAGYNAQISADGQNVVYRETTIGADHLRRSSLISQKLESRQTTMLVKETRDLEGFVIRGNTVMAVNKKKVQAQSLNSNKVETMPVLSIKDQQLMISKNGTSRILSPNGTNHSYIWPSISPDGKKVCYYVCADGCYVANIDGSNVQRIGKVHAPKWYDNNTIIGMQEYDDGEFIYASYIVAANLKGYIQRLTDDRMIAMYPYAVDGMIVFATIEGETYLMNVK